MPKYSGRNVQRLRRLVYSRDNGICGICGEFAPFDLGHIDHITPRVNGGNNQGRNLQWTHAKCNLRKGVRGGGRHTEKSSEIAPFPFSLPVDGLW
jgi:5-methylcytosine-specific restriction endonuclease McrA